jgi:hypothetical protein
MARDPSAILAKIRAAHTGATARIVELETERAAKIASGSLDSILAIDRQIEELRKAASIYADQVVAVTAEVRKYRHQERLRDRETLIVEIAAKLGDRDKIGVALEKAIGDVAKLYVDLGDAREKVFDVFRSHRDLLYLPSQYDLTPITLRDRIVNALRSRFADPSEFAQRIGPVAEQIAQIDADFLRRVKTSALPEIAEPSEDQGA